MWRALYDKEYDALGSGSVAGAHVRLIYYLKTTLPSHPRWSEIEPLLEKWEWLACRSVANTEHENVRFAVRNIVGDAIMDGDPWSAQPSPTFDSMQLVLPQGLYISSDFPACDSAVLRQAGITHIVQALPQPPRFPHVAKYHVIPILDTDSQRIDFDAAVAFIADALQVPGNKVLVHCKAGISRSASVVLAYMMWSTRMPLNAAFGFLVACRPYVFPNAGFRQQLRAYEKRVLKR